MRAHQSTVCVSRLPGVRRYEKKQVNGTFSEVAEPLDSPVRRKLADAAAASAVVSEKTRRPTRALEAYAG